MSHDSNMESNLQTYHYSKRETFKLAFAVRALTQKMELRITPWIEIAASTTCIVSSAYYLKFYCYNYKEPRVRAHKQR